MNQVGSIAEEQLAELLLHQLKMHPKFTVKDAWGEFGAQWNWEWFATMTFKKDIHPEAAVKLFKVWASKLSRDIYGTRWYKKSPYGVQYILAIEHTKAGRVHLHAIIKGVQEALRDNFVWMQKWEDIDKYRKVQVDGEWTKRAAQDRAGYARIYPVENAEAVAQYVTKYCTKDGELFFSEHLIKEARTH